MGLALQEADEETQKEEGEGYRPASSLRHEAQLLVRLAVPVAIARVSMLAMGLVDTFMVGKLGKIQLAAVALADACFFTLIVMAIGLIQSLDPLVSQAHGAGDPKRCTAAHHAGIRIAMALALPLALAVLSLQPLLSVLGGQNPDVVRSAALYLAPVALGVPAQLFYVAHVSFVQGLGDTRPAMIVAIVANVLNVFLDYALIFGHWGFPALGVAGAGAASAGSRWFMCFLLWAWVRRHPRYARYQGRPGVPWPLINKALRLGTPIGLAHGAEVGAFSLASVFMGWLSVEALAAHQITIKMAATSFMLAVALGIATSIRVGNGIGAGRPQDAQRSAWVGVVLGLCVMALTGLAFLLGGAAITGAFTDDAGVIAVGAGLFAVAAAFQLSDGVQAVAAGALRGAGNTLEAMAAQIFAHWAIGIPVGYLLAFRFGWGPTGVWWALALGLTAAAGLLLWRMRKIHGVVALED
ncbi:MAG TPA: hypothetical protein DEA08_24330 [Planctomycetes bacterium]|nr:hypothetical protein [Planctomycetota bacterium]